MAESDLSHNQNQRKRCRENLIRAGSEVAVQSAASAPRAVADEPAKSEEKVDTELELFAVPSTPPSTKLLITHLRAQLLKAPQRQNIEEGAPTLFALPNTSLDKSFEEFTPTAPTTKYAQDFPALHLNSTPKNTNGASVKASKRSGKDIEALARSLSKNSTEMR